MSNQSGVVIESTLYRERAADREQEFERLLRDLNTLRRARPRDLDQIGAIGNRLRHLADEQRKEVPPRFDQKHQVSLWRRWDVQARIADNIVNADGRNLEALDAEYEAVVERSFFGVTPADIALMQLTGDPLVSFDPPAEPDDDSVAVGCMFSVVVFATSVVLRNAGLPAFAVIVVVGWFVFYLVAMAVPALGERVGLRSPERPQIPEGDRKCPGYKTYRDLINEFILTLNGNIASVDHLEVTPWDLRRVLSDTEVVIGKMRRLAVPPVTKELHDVLLELNEGWIGLFQGRLDRTLTGDEFGKVEVVGDRANELFNQLDTTCAY